MTGNTSELLDAVDLMTSRFATPDSRRHVAISEKKTEQKIDGDLFLERRENAEWPMIIMTLTAIFHDFL